MKILKKILWCFAIVFVWLGLLLKFLKAKRLAKLYNKDPISVDEERRLKFVYKFAKLFLFSKRINIEHVGREKIESKPMLFISNHKSNLDPIILFKEIYEQKVPRPIFVAKIELSTSKLSCILDLVDTIYIDRENLRNVFQVIQKETELLKEKVCIVVFPEGTRVKGDEIGEYKSASLTPAFESMSSIQPVVLFNTENLLETHPLSNKYDRTVYINFLNSFQPVNFITSQKDLFANKLRNLTQEEYNKIKANVIK